MSVQASSTSGIERLGGIWGLLGFLGDGDEGGGRGLACADHDFHPLGAFLLALGFDGGDAGLLLGRLHAGLPLRRRIRPALDVEPASGRQERQRDPSGDQKAG